MNQLNFNDLPMCNAKVRGDTKPCALNYGHRGYHTSCVFTCDECGKRRRLNSIVLTARDSEGYPVETICFLCAKNKKWWW
jgi:hypothetical protein